MAGFSMKPMVTVVAVCAVLFVSGVTRVEAAPAEQLKTSGWTSETQPAEKVGAGAGSVGANPVLCKSIEKGVIERIEVMRSIRFGGQKPPPLLPSTLSDWHKQTQIDPDAKKKYASEEAMVKRLNGYMIDNGCTPVDIEAELRKGPINANAEKR